MKNELIITGLVVVGLYSLAYWDSNRTHEHPAATATGTVIRTPYWCGTSFDDAVTVTLAVHDHDVLALAGMVSRGNAFQVEEGTRVYNGGIVDMKISSVRIASGFQTGRKCYVWSGVLQ